MKISIRILLLLLLLATGYGETIVYLAPIQGTIDLGLPPFIERVIENAEEAGAAAIIFDIDTFGGRIDAATQIKDAIMESTVPTIAYVNRRAISAGALIALSCESIVMTSGGTIGAATAVDMSGEKASEKVISYMREEMAATAEKRGRNTTIAKSMVDEQLSFTHVVIDGDSIEVGDLEGRKEGKLITLTTEEALKYKMVDGTVESLIEVLEFLDLPDAEIISEAESWSENLVRFLTNPIVASLLTTFGFLGILFELQSPGWGLPGTFGAICLALSLGASYLANLASMTDLLFVIAGVVLLLLEILVIPGFGIAGILGILLIFGGMFALLIPDIPVGPEVYSGAITGFSIGIIGGIIGLVLIFRILIKTDFWKKITSPGIQRHEDGYDTSIGLEGLVGQMGQAVTDLRPSGWITMGEQRIFVVSEGGFISKGEPVKILVVEGNRVVVRKINVEVKE
ncbi:MAG: NfeD family protein [Candidatus Neomarinimicrobiota bacterium]